MSRPKEKIPVNPSQTGLNTAFAGLEIPGLPPGPHEAVAAEPAGTGGGGLPLKGGVGVRPGRVVLRREKAHRGGKTVVVVEGFSADHDEAGIERLARRLRLACGAGGTAGDRRIEIQGEQVGRVRAFLELEGFQVGGER
jgi:translation initiation factor 1